MTAGHCGLKGDEFYYDAFTIGTVKRRLFPAPGHHAVADAELIGVSKKYATSRLLVRPPNRHSRIMGAAGPNEGEVGDRQHPGTILCAIGYVKHPESFEDPKAQVLTTRCAAH